MQFATAKEGQHLIPFQLFAQDGPTRRISAVCPEHVLRQIEPDYDNLRHGRPPVRILADPPCTSVPSGGGHIINARPWRNSFPFPHEGTDLRSGRLQEGGERESIGYRELGVAPKSNRHEPQDATHEVDAADGHHDPPSVLAETLVRQALKEAPADRGPQNGRSDGES